MKKHTKCRMNEICRKPHRDGECERSCYYNTIEVKTKADTLRAMSDEELADVFSSISCCHEKGQDCMKYSDGMGGRNCYQCWLDWLKEEASDET